MEQDDGECEVCGQPVRVRVLEGYTNGAPVLRRYCMDCAAKLENRTALDAAPARKQRLGVASLLIAAGLMIAILGAMGDYIGIHGAFGFGWRQSLGVGIGAFLVLLGALLRADVITMFGSLVLGLAASSDLLGLSGAGGIGWKQHLAIVLGAILMLLGLMLRRRA